jgi:DNA excision repair protein ERCC-8
VACATADSAVRLVDLKSGDTAHSLPGHVGAVLCTSWSPINENLLLSGGVDGMARLWDIRRSSSGDLGWLDMNKSSAGQGASSAMNSKAHSAPVNGVIWSSDGKYAVTSGHDDKIRVWHAASRVNTLVNFGPMVQTSRNATVQPLLVPTDLSGISKPILFFPNNREVLAFGLTDGALLKRMRPLRKPGDSHLQGPKKSQHFNNALVWRPESLEMYSAHADGTIQVWLPEEDTSDIAIGKESGSGDESETDSRKRKRDILDDVYRQMTSKKFDA